MDGDEAARPSAFPRSEEAFSALVAYLRSDEALELPLEELVAFVESEYQALMATLLQEHDDLIARRQAPAAAGDAEKGAGDGC